MILKGPILLEVSIDDHVAHDGLHQEVMHPDYIMTLETDQIFTMRSKQLHDHALKDDLWQLIRKISTRLRCFNYLCPPY